MGADEFTEINYPVPEILVNGMDDVVNISQALIDEITITASLDSYGRTDNVDWWLAQVGPYGIFYLTPSMWTPVQTPFYQGPLFPIATYGFSPIATSGLATGTYILYFSVDTVVDGRVSFDDIYTSFVIVNITR